MDRSGYSDEDDDETISRIEAATNVTPISQLLHAGGKTYANPPEAVSTTTGEGYILGEAAPIDRALVDAILNSNNDQPVVDKLEGGYLYDAQVKNRTTRKRAADVNKRTAMNEGEWVAFEIVGLCKAIDMNNNRLENVDIGLAKLLVPTRSKDQIQHKLKNFKELYTEYTQRRLDRVLRHQPTGSTPTSEKGRQVRSQPVVKPSPGQRCKRKTEQRKRELDFYLSQTASRDAPAINLEERLATLDSFLDKQDDSVEEKRAKLDCILDAQAEPS